MLRSNHYETDREGFHARLHNNASAWCVLADDFSHLSTKITATFASKTWVYAVSSQGSSVDNAWVNNYYMTINGHKGPLEGNTDPDTVVTSMWPGAPLGNRYSIQYTPLNSESTSPDGTLCARLEFYGLNEGE